MNVSTSSSVYATQRVTKPTNNPNPRSDVQPQQPPPQPQATSSGPVVNTQGQVTGRHVNVTA